MALLLLFHQWPLPSRIALSGSQIVLDRDGAPLHVYLAADERWRIPLTLDRVDPAYIEALLALEDSRFYWHPGVDPFAIIRAVGSNLSAGRIVSGASTLTMQLVRMSEPRPRTLPSKAIEAVRALQLEFFFSKDEILEAYLQLAPFGRNIEGVEAASLAYFSHRAKSLSPEEIALLLAVPQDPNGRYPAHKNHARLTLGRGQVAQRLFEDGLFDQETLSAVNAAQLPGGLSPFPRLAPHASDFLRRRGEGDFIASSLGRSEQTLAENVMARYQGGLSRKGIHNGVAVVLDHRSGQCLALVGNFDFWDEDHGGQIPGFLVPRSVGSTLKPMLYAHGIDQGLSLPGFLVPDVPVYYGGYNPKNYDGGFLGLVTLEDALSRSLNVPFVNLLSAIGIETFLGQLRDLGATNLVETPGHYGLSLVAGGIELSPLEVAGFYMTLANRGEMRPVSFDTTEAVEALRVMSPGASYLTRNALSKRDRPDFPHRRRIARLPADVHWKTGTSFGHRDAWAVGSSSSHTVLVWLGNFDNTSSRHLVGAEAAGPILFDILEGLGGNAFRVEGIPDDLKILEVCTFSGHALGPACPTSTTALGLIKHMPTGVCPYHISRDVDAETGLALTPTCRGERSYSTQSFLQIPSTVRRYLSEVRGPLQRPPSFMPGCEAQVVVEPPHIVSPAKGKTMVLLPGLDADKQELPLIAESTGGDGILSWFVDGRYLGQASQQNRLWWTPSPGRHAFVVVDEQGQKSEVTIAVRLGR